MPTVAENLTPPKPVTYSIDKEQAVCKGKMAKRICEILETPNLILSSARVAKLFAVGKTAYIFDKGEKHYPRIVSRAQNNTDEGTGRESAELLKLISEAVKTKEQKTKVTTTIAEAAFDKVSDDIFADAGEYKFKVRNSKSQSVAGVTFEFSNTLKDEEETAAMIPESLNDLLQFQQASPSAPDRSDDYAECYPVDGFPEDYDDDDDDKVTRNSSPSSKSTLTKRQQRHRESQKLDKTLRKVTKIMKSSSKSKINEE